MQKRKTGAIKSNILLFLVVAVIIAVFVTAKFSGRVVPNLEGAVGNTACNLYNNGLFCADDDKIYFSNLNDGGALYSMSKDLSDFEYMFIQGLITLEMTVLNMYCNFRIQAYIEWQKKEAMTLEVSTHMM